MGDKTTSRQEHPVERGKLASTTIRRGSYTVNVDYFKTWSHEMAYILGYTATDGCIRINNEVVRKDNSSIKSYRGIYQVTWSVTDLDVLQFIKKELEAEHPIIERPTTYYPSMKNPKPQWYMTINSKDMIFDLMNLGIHPRKSKTILFPDDYPDEFMRDYLRGVMDGDGCWSLDIAHKNAHPRAFITSGSKIFLQSIGEYLKDVLGIIPKIYTNKRGIHNLSYSGPEVAALANYFKDSGFMIERKRLRMEEVSSGYEVRHCIHCNRPFVRVAGLQNICRSCKKKGCLDHDMVSSA